ncbi:MAG: LamG-like jellyroll fold domain-containing protein [Candidatus Paceibacterota bacterium]|jgi:prepilin-type N-terminal cleavage/methylation domain-containing protein
MNKRAFTLIELLVVIAIVGILSSVIYTNITGLRDRAKITAGIRFDSSLLHSIGDQLIGEWMFDTNTNPTPDTSGSGYNGTISGATYATTSGYNNKGTYNFDGNDYITISSPIVGGLNSATMCMWINPTYKNDTAYNAPGGLTGTSNRASFSLLIQASNNRMFFYANTSVGYSSTGDSEQVIYDTWQHFCGVYDGSKLYLYKNGVNVNSGAQSGTIESSGIFRIGSWGLGNFFKGYIDDVRIYSSALSGSEIQKLYVKGATSHISSLK